MLKMTKIQESADRFDSLVALSEGEVATTAAYLRARADDVSAAIIMSCIAAVVVMGVIAWVALENGR
jgi:hypothetical protein